MQVVPLVDYRFVSAEFSVELLSLFGIVPNFACAELGLNLLGFLLGRFYVKDSRAYGLRGRAHPQWVQRNSLSLGIAFLK